jgi:PAS domain S-box-containing protein
VKKPCLIKKNTGLPLREIIRGKKATISEILWAIGSLAESLHELHQHEIIHKDLRPDNIFVDWVNRETWLLDFSISTFLPRETLDISSPDIMKGTLAYMSPEQTGRMNRSVDYRTDFYSLGVIFYEMLTGRVPFDQKEPLELVHSLLARQPLPPHHLDPEIPNVVSDIVLKLLSKRAEKRYQSARGIQSDIERCLKQMDEKGFIEQFKLGENDRSEKFQISQKLYGREAQRKILLECFDAASQGKSELVMVSGYSGIGKTSLIREIYKSVTWKKGYFISGKFDEFNRNVPYNAMVCAFHEMVRQILSESDNRLHEWKARLLENLGDNGRVITDVIPGIEKILGTQPEIKALGNDDAQMRFERVFMNFIQVFCTKDHPLVIFLDDLQWIDKASLKLIDLMAKSENIKYLMFIGAYRDNEATSIHPLIIMLEALKSKNISVRHINLSPLDRSAVYEMIMDTFKSNSGQVRTIAESVFAKTQGNPFFVIQFLITLYKEKLIRFEGEQDQWSWDIAGIDALGVTENVIDLLVYRLRQMPPETQDVIKMAACIGSHFDLQTLSLITGHFPEETLENLLPAIKEELIVKASSNEMVLGLDIYDSMPTGEFRFQHDRVHQAAGSLIDEADKQPIHLQIGEILLENLGADDLEEQIFDVLSHLNFAAEWIDRPEDRTKLSELNLIAGKKALKSVAFEQAYTYLKMGIEYLPGNAWQTHYQLSLELHMACVEAARLIGKFDEMETYFSQVYQHAGAIISIVDAYRSRIRACVMQNKLLEAFHAACEFLDSIGENVPGNPTADEAGCVLERTLGSLGEKHIEDLVNLPVMHDPNKLAAMNILSEVSSSVFIGVPHMFLSLICKQVDLSISYGNTAESAFSYAAFGAILCRISNDIEKGYQFGKLAVALMKKMGAPEMEAKVYHAVSAYINHLKEPIQRTMELSMTGYQSAMETGDFEFAGYNVYTYNKHSLLSGRGLKTTQKEMSDFGAAIKRLKQETPYHFNEIFHQAALNLMGKCNDPTMLAGDAYDEHEMLPKHRQANDHLAIIYYGFCKLMLCTLFGRNVEAMEYSDLVEKESFTLPGTPMAYTLFHYFDSLARLSELGECDEMKRDVHMKRVMENQEKLKFWAGHAPSNYLHKYHLVEAEIRRALGRHEEALVQYDIAIELANKSTYTNDEALANELTARYWLARERKELARPFIQKAHTCYLRWGALAKVSQLEASFPHLLNDDMGKVSVHQENAYEADHFFEGGAIFDLDIVTIMKTTQAISSEIELNKLLVTLMRHTIENVGAQRGTLILMVNDQPLIAAQGGVDGHEQLFDPFIALDEGQSISTAIINYTIHSREPVILNNAVQEGMFVGDSYIQASKPLSVVCFPILHKSRLTGLIYLENTLLTGVFSKERIEILKVLSSQMGISIENARLYEDRKKAEEEYRGIFENAVEGIYRTTPDGRFVDINPAAARMFGYSSPQEAISNVADVTWQIYVNAEDRKEFLSVLKKSGFISNYEVPMYKKDGEIMWVSLNARPIVDNAGEIKFIEGFINDITVRKQVTDLLLEQGQQLRKENVLLRSRMKERYRFGRIIGKSKAMQEVYELIIKAAATDENVIVYGESGTGKELVASEIHTMSTRKSRPFVTVNCGAIPENLMESEFFGYKRGAFTGANSDRKGYLDQADKGTIFLDELGEIDVRLQVKLLRVLDGGGYIPLGSNQVKIPDLRIIAATNKDFKTELQAGRIREDFFYRIHVIPIHMPPLRERKDDIPLLLEHFLGIRYGGKETPKIPGQVVDAMMEYDWPGNVREFQNTLNRYVSLKKLDFFGSRVSDVVTMAKQPQEISLRVEDQGYPLQDAVSEYEKTYILKLLEANRWNKGKVAGILEIDRKTLYRKLSRYGMLDP